MRSALLFTLLLLAAPLTGCISNGDGDQATLPDGDDAPTTTWQTATQTGTLEGAGTPGPSIATGENTATWNVPDTAFLLRLDIAADGTLTDEVTYQYGPDCETEPTVQCSYNGQTDDGQASIAVDDPDAGSWEIFFFHDTNAGDVDWTLDITIGERT